jgi:quercetin dioxygenase-like cupin family protein
MEDHYMVESDHSHRPMAKPTRQLDIDRVIVTEWRFAPGARTGWHVHEYDYVVVPLTTGSLLLDTKDGVVSADLAVGRSYGRERGVEHDVINDNPFEFIFIEIEIK